MGETNGSHRGIFSMRSTGATTLSLLPRGRTKTARHIAGFLAALMAVVAMALGSAAGTELAEAQTDPSTDRVALVALYNATDGPNWSNETNWLSAEPIGEWHGVITDGSGRVTALDLDENELNGKMPAELGDLTNLQSLSLNDNSGLSGPLPGSFTGLTSLTYLDLSGTGMCAPTDASFQTWLENIATRLGVVNCREQTAEDPLIDRYDANNNGTIEKSEVIQAINDYLDGGGISKTDVIKLINIYLDGPATHNPPGTPEGLTATGNGETRIDLSWSAPPSDGGAAITGYRIEVSEDRSTWTDLVANTGNAATSYSHTGLTAGTTRHYQVSAINSAGTGPASNIATGNTDTSSGNQAPDLVVGTPSVSDDSPTAGASFTLSATVRNQGGGSSASTTLRYYRSTDSTISSADTQVGTDSVGGLAASGTSAESISVTAPSAPGTYYYGACVDSVSGESDTGNNCSSGVAVAVGTPPTPDLVVGTPSVDDSSPTAGASFTLSATVRNRGSGSSAATTLRYYRSADSTISSADTQVGTDSVGGLAASGTSAESISVTAPSAPGTYYYGACVDSVSGESDTGNNCSSGVAVAVGTPPTPDLVVGTPSVDDSSPTAGASFTLSATVRNRGSGSSAATTLRYYRSADSTISSADTQVGTDSVGGLAASGTSAESISVTAPSAPGTYYYGACVDSVPGESNTGNNCSSGVAVAVSVATAPDLVVGTPSVSDDSPTAGASFTLSATVRNQGGGSSAATTLRYYRSADSTISSADTQVGTDSVGGLSASGTSPESTSVTAPSTAGTYYYGACVDSVSGESNTTNNCSSGVAVTVSAAPDLVVGTPTVDDDSPTTGESFTLSATVRNQGSGSSAATTLRYYRSTDATISSSDTSAGTDSVVGLSASGTSPESISVTAPSTAGTYYYGACVDSVSGESDTTNNCSSGVAVTVSAAPDLVVGTPTVDDSSPTTGESFTLSATVRNQGSGSSGSTTLRYYRSADSTISSADTQVGTDSVGGLSASGTSPESTSVTAPSTAGTYYYGACVDSVTGENVTDNNCSSGVAVTVSAAPDLVVGTPTVDDDSPTTGESFTLSATVRNQGSGSSAATTLRYYRSTDATISSSDTSAGTDSVVGLSASGTSAESISVTAPSTAGTYYYGACVDSVSGESNTTNNCSSGVAVAVGTPPAPDLVVGTPTVDDDSPTTGESFTLSATVRNQGSGSSAATTLRYYRSTDATISSSDTSAGTDSVGGLSASGTSPESTSVTAPSTAGTYYYGACVDSVSGESNTTNNCSSGVAVTVSAAPDLVVGTPTVDDDSPTTGETFTLSATVRNQGSGSSAATTLRYYRSTDATISSSDTSAGTDSVVGLSASGTSPESISVTAPSTAGTYYYGACVDSVSGESNTGNNCSSGVAVAVTVSAAPDLVVGTPTVDDSSPTTGETFTLSATVRNQGSASSGSTTLRYYRSTDSTISSSDTSAGTDSVGGLSASGTSPESISVTAPSTAGTYYYGACVDSVSGESNTTNNCSTAVTVTVTAAAAPDLVVGTPSVNDSSPTTGETFTLSATVRNQGSGSSAATTLRYYRSTDATISSSDTSAGTDSVVGLSASGTSAESISVTAPSTAGTYYYGACVDSVTGENVTDNNCSSGVAVTVSAAPDLVVGTPSVNDSSPTTGETFTLSATVRNQGSASSGSTTLRYYRSTDSTISSSDTSAGTDSVGGLSASGTSPESISVTAPSTAGTYYYGACVDSVSGESNTGNNCSSGVAVAVSVATAPDLVVGTPSVFGSSPTAGASFILAATVRNQGNDWSAATTLHFYRSTDSTISSSDTSVGMVAVVRLSAPGTDNAYTSLTAPSTAGTYYYGACVDSVPGESNTGNNCSSGVAVAVSVATAPDLVVGTPSVSDSSPTAGTSFTLSATVRNQGGAASAATTLRYYRSTNSTISSADTQVGTDSVGGLAASGTSAESISLTAPSTAGTYYYGACVDSVSGESNTTNNCSSGVTVTVEAAAGPDLVVGAPSVSDSSPDAGASFTLSATVRNQGSGSSAATTLRYYRSTNSTISSADTAVGTDSVGGLSASGTSAESTSLTAPSTAGTYYYGACVDSVSGESNTTNNCSSGVAVTVSTQRIAFDINIDTCRGTYNSFADHTRVTIEGTVSSNYALITLELTGYIVEGGDETEIDTDDIFRLSANSEEDFEIDGFYDGRIGSGASCGVRVTDYTVNPLQ